MNSPLSKAGMMLVIFTLSLFAWVASPAYAATAHVDIPLGAAGTGYNPASLQVSVGDTVVWTHNDMAGIPHTVTSDTSLFGSAFMNAGDSFSFTFTSPGSFAYHCQVHPFVMKGFVNVVPPTYAVQLFEGSNPSDGKINPGDSITGVAMTNDSGASQVTFKWINPFGDTARSEAMSLAKGKAQDTFAPTDPGQWKLEADFGNGNVAIKAINVDFAVLPESPLGAAALVGSSFAALGALVILKKRKNRSDGL